MSLLDKFFRTKKEEKKESFEFGKLKLYESYLDQDPDARAEDYWIECIDSSEDGYWTLIGRRFGIFTLYNYKGNIVRLPSKPPSQAVLEVLFKKDYLAILAPPYVVIYYMEDPYDPKTWKSTRIVKEGTRPWGGIDIENNLLIFGATSNQIITLDITQSFNQKTAELNVNFRHEDLGEVKFIKIINNTNIFIGATKNSAIYSLAGMLLKKFEGANAFVYKNQKVYCANEKELFTLDVNTHSKEIITTLDFIPSSIDISDDESFLFLAAKNENKLTIVDLSIKNIIGYLDKAGYGIVNVSKDGSIYSSFYKKEDDKELYYFKKFDSNLIDFYLPKEQYTNMTKNAKNLLKDLEKSLEKIEGNSLEEKIENLYNLKPYNELLSLMSFPIKELRNTIENAKNIVKNKELELIYNHFNNIIESKNIKEEDFKKISELLSIKLPKEWGEKFSSLEQKAKDYFDKVIEDSLEKVKTVLEKQKPSSINEAFSIEEIKEIRSKFLELPKEFEDKALTKLNITIQEMIIENRLNRYKITIDKDKIKIGKIEARTIKAKKHKLVWNIKVEDSFIKDGKFYSKIAFVRQDDKYLEPKRYRNILSEEELRHKPKWVKRYLKHLNNLFGYEDISASVPIISYEETPWFVENLEKLSYFLNEQLNYQEGIVILEGDAGVGKNFLVEVYAALTNRPLFIVPCNSKMEKEDITFIYEYDPKRGTKRTKSNLVKALETEGAIIYFDEINTLPHSLIKIFNPLFDYRRYLFLSYDQTVKAQKDVLLIGGMNPQNYLGVSELPQDIKSRCDIMYVDYPPFKDERGFYYPDEALILKNYLADICMLNKEDFVYLWYFLVNNIETERAKNIYTKDREKKIKDLFEIVKIANAIRSAYRAYQSQTSEEPVDFVFSIRDSIRCTRRLKDFESPKDIVIKTVLPKISNSLERKIIEDIIERDIV